jgi:small-conductance mechanosensitive channel/CRP-like cAMP-binding protein
MDTWLELAAWLGGWALATYLLTLVMQRLAARQHPLAMTVAAARNLLLPLFVGVRLADRVAERPDEDTLRRVLETLMWIAVIHVVLSFVRNTALVRNEAGQQRSTVPKLLIDILRLLLVLVGAAIVISSVWEADLGSLLTAIGVSSIVLGLALQNTLDNVMAGIAVLFEHPFDVGDWIKVGDLSGEVMEMNWRSVRVRTRDRDLVVVPNSVIGKETIINLSRPSRAHGERVTIGFSYDDPPNKVKRIMQSVALRTRGVTAQPTPVVHVVKYNDFTIDYEIWFFIEDFERQPEIMDEFMTLVWYAAKRNGLNIPYPIQTAFETSVEPVPKPDVQRAFRDSLAGVPVFVPLSPEELESLSHEAVREDYGRGERVVNQGDKGDSFFLIQEGTAIVSARDAEGADREVARLGRGEFFGEMSALTGEARSASVTAADDLGVLVLHKSAFRRMLAARASLAQEMAEIVEARRQGLRAVQDMRGAPSEQRESIRRGASELVGRIKRFLGI